MSTPIALIQTRMENDPETNIKKALELVEKALKTGAKILSLPELFNTKYFPILPGKNYTDLACTIPGSLTETFKSLAKTYEATLILPIYEKKDDRYFNSSAVIDFKGEYLPVYRKIHIPNDPYFHEKDYFKEGQEYRLYESQGLKFSVLICYDQWFPEAARACTLLGADLIIYPTALGTINKENQIEGNWKEAWTTVQRGHAISNGVHIASVNRCGIENNLNFFGSSFICGPFGEILAQASGIEEIIYANIDPSRNRIVQEGWGFIKNRRPDTYWSLGQSLDSE